MAIRIKTSSGWKEVTGLHARDAQGVQELTEAHAQVAADRPLIWKKPVVVPVERDYVVSCEIYMHRLINERSPDLSTRLGYITLKTANGNSLTHYYNDWNESSGGDFSIIEFADFHNEVFGTGVWEGYVLPLDRTIPENITTVHDFPDNTANISQVLFDVTYHRTEEPGGTITPGVGLPEGYNLRRATLYYQGDIRTYYTDSTYETVTTEVSVHWQYNEPEIVGPPGFGL